MAALSTKRIITFFGGFSIAAAILYFLRPKAASLPERDIDPYEYPAVRAHVYYASPDETFAAAKQAASSVGATFSKTGDDGFELEMPIPGTSDMLTLAAIYRALGQFHTRMAIGDPTGQITPTPATHEGIRRFQSEMDALLTGG